MYCPLGAFIRGLCTGVKSSQWLFFIAEETISIAGYLDQFLTGFSALQVAAGGSVGRQELDLLLLRRLGSQDWLGLPL